MAWAASGLATRGDEGPRWACRRIEELVGRDAADDALRVKARLLEGDVFNPQVKARRGLFRDPLLGPKVARVVPGDGKEHVVGELVAEVCEGVAPKGNIDLRTLEGVFVRGKIKVRAIRSAVGTMSCIRP